MHIGAAIEQKGDHIVTGAAEDRAVQWRAAGTIAEVDPIRFSSRGELGVRRVTFAAAA